LPESERRFVEAMARFLVPWGVPLTAARLYGYLLLRAEPVSLDQMAADLEVSKSSASVAARLLELYTLAHRQGQRGSRRVLYQASDNYEAMLTAQNRALETGAELLRSGAHDAVSEPVRARLEEMAEFYLVTRNAMESALRHWRARPRT
jgi:HTH-type transcriptional regulator, osmoprotectant uptake regulator